MANVGFPYIYAALRTGITGTDTSIDENTIEFLKKVGAGGSKIYGGFGISNGKQAKVLADKVDAVVAGSVFVRTINETSGISCDELYRAVRKKAEELTSGQ